MLSYRTRTRKWKGKETQHSAALWFWGFIAVFLAMMLALMIASRDQPANASLEIWSADLTAGPNVQTLKG